MKKSWMYGALILASTVVSRGAVVLTASPSAPVVGSSDQASLNDAAVVPGGIFDSQAFSNNGGPPGQTFTTGNADSYTLTSFSFKGAAAGSTNYGGMTASTTWGIRISSVSGTTMTPLLMVTNIPHAAGSLKGDEWFSWTFSGNDSLKLKGSTTYSFETYSSEGWLGFDASDSDDAYIWGKAFNVNGTSMGFSSTALQERLYDRTFVAKLTAVPEPSAAMTLAGLGLLLAGRRRR